MQYLRYLLDMKIMNEAYEDPKKDKFLAAEIIRHFSAPEDGKKEAGSWASTLYRGMVLASRMTAIFNAPETVDAGVLVSAGGWGKCAGLLCRLCHFVLVFAAGLLGV